MRINGKRLAKKNDTSCDEDEYSHNENFYNIVPLSISDNITNTSNLYNDIFIMSLTDKSFIVRGNLLDHGSKLVELVGKYSPEKEGYIFANFRKESVENYIQTGEVKPYQYTEEQKKRFMQSIHKVSNTKNNTNNTNNTNTTNTTSNYNTPINENVYNERTWTIYQLKSIFQEIRDAFEENAYYQGESIFDVMNQIEEKYLPKPKVIKAIKQ